MVKLANLFPERLHDWVTGELLGRQFSLRSEVRGQQETQECSHAGVTMSHHSTGVADAMVTGRENCVYCNITLVKRCVCGERGGEIV